MTDLRSFVVFGLVLKVLVCLNRSDVLSVCRYRSDVLSVCRSNRVSLEVSIQTPIDD